MSRLLPKLSVIRSTHWAAKHVIRKLGYQCDLRRQGDLKIGLWRRKFKRAKNKNERLVIVPGFGDSPLSWMLLLGVLKPVIQKNFDEIIFVDFPGFSGFLAGEKAFHSVDLMQASFFDILDTLKPKTVLGHSLGGWLASLYAVECAEGIRPKPAPSGAPSKYKGPADVVLCNASGVFQDEATAQEMQNRFIDAAKDKELGFEVLRPHVWSKEPFWFEWLESQVGHFFGNDEIQAFIHSAERSHLIAHHRLAKIQAQIWLIWGEHDSLVPPSCLPIWLKEMGSEKCKALVIKNCGHMPHVESPATLAWLLSGVFSQKPGKLTQPEKSPLTRNRWSAVGLA